MSMLPIRIQSGLAMERIETTMTNNLCSQWMMCVAMNDPSRFQSSFKVDNIPH